MQIEYPVLCQFPGCGRPAGFKVASQWSDGTTHELKTYSLSCEFCLPSLLRQARVLACCQKLALVKIQRHSRLKI